ncbi:MAG: serine hydrolase, partial [Planctomycetota bacterium]
MPLAPLALALAPLLFSNPLAARPDLSAQVVDAPQEARPAVEPGAGAAPAAARKVPAGVRLSEQSCAAAAAYSENRAGRALLVVQGGRDVFETYANGWSADRPHPLASGTKSFNGVLAMAALEDGVIPGLDVPASTFVEEWADDPAKKDITIRQLLELSSGLAPNDPSLGRQGYGIKGLGPLNDFAQRLRRREDPPANRFEAALRVPSVAEPGAGFDYGPTHFYAFGALIERALAKSGREERTYFEYLKNRVLDPAGIPVDIERFAPDAANKPNLPGGGHFTAHEWARFGEWVLRGGAHVGEDGALVRDLGEHALDPCFEPSATNPNYGLT